MKRDLQMLYGIGLAAFMLALIISLLMGLSISNSNPHDMSATDIAILVGVAFVMLPSMAALVVNNFIFLGQKKNWRDFWSGDMFEYFSEQNVTEKWRIARGRFMLFTATFLSAFLVIWLYGQMRGS